LQARCHDLIHVDLPWNPSRLEQRNGRVDRKLQPSKIVTCRYFIYHQREEDRVLDALVRKTVELHEPWRFFETALGWPARLVAGSPGGPAVLPELTITVPEHETLLSPDMAILWNGEAPEGVPVQALVIVQPSLDPDGRNQFSAGEWEASPHQRLERLLRETSIGVGLLIARNTLRLIYAPRGETAGWLSWPLAALGRVEGRPMLAGLKLCLGRNAFFTGFQKRPQPRLRGTAKRSLGKALGSGSRRSL
jgi:hypothetical protein